MNTIFIFPTPSTERNRTLFFPTQNETPYIHTSTSNQGQENTLTTNIQPTEQHERITTLMTENLQNNLREQREPIEIPQRAPNSRTRIMRYSTNELRALQQTIPCTSNQALETELKIEQPENNWESDSSQ